MSVAIAEKHEVLARPSQRDLEILMRAPGPCASILMNTSPSGRMGGADRARLKALGHEAVRRLRMEPGLDETEALTELLARALEEAANGPADRSVAVFANGSSSYVFHLPKSLDERVVIDPTFATRDIVSTVQENPKFLLLHLDSKSANLYFYNQKYLEPVLSPEFPALREGRVRTRQNLEGTRRFLRDIDTRTGRYLAKKPLPLVLVGGDRILAEYLRISRYGTRIAALRKGIHSRPSLQTLEQIGRDAMADHVEDLNAAALDTLESRIGAGQALSGLLACWHVSTTGKPELLVVEQGFQMPAKSVAGGRYVEPVEDPEHPGVIDDAVDDLIENVLRAGGFVAVVPDGSLREHGRVALTVTR